MRVSAKIEGAEELIAALQKMGVDVGQMLEVAATAGAQVIAEGANGFAPAPEISTETAKRTASRVEVNIGPPDDKWYWKFIETGAGQHEISGPLAIPWDGEMHLVGGASHPGMIAQPFLRPAFDTRQTLAVNAVGEKLRKAVTP